MPQINRPPSSSLRSWFILLAACLCLASCQSTVQVIDANRSETYEDLPRCLLNSRKLSRITSTTLRASGLSVSNFKSDSSNLLQSLADLERQWEPSLAVDLEQRIALAELYLQAARALDSSSDPQAIGHYLRSAELAFPLALQYDPRVANSSQETFLIAIYNHVCGQVAKHWFESRSTPEMATRIFSIPRKNYRLALKPASANTIDPSDFDEFKAIDQLEIKGLRSHTHENGIGAPLIAIQNTTPERLDEHPYLPESGAHSAATASLDFSPRDNVILTYHDTRESTSANFGGTTVALAADFSAPLALTLSSRSDRDAGFWGLFRPEGYTDAMGLYTLEPVDPEKIPVILVHGLLSKPSTWKNAYNELLADPVIREHYQFWYFQYPTGYPIIFPAAGFRDALIRIRDHYDPAERYETFDQLVVIGHSLGGVLTSTQIRDINGDLWDEFFTKPIADLDLDPETRQSLSRFFFPEEEIYIDRVIFIATPHRGSSIADSWIGRIVSSLVTIPQEIISFQLVDAVSTMTEIGQSLLSQPGNSINWLRLQSPGLSSIVALPILPDITYHSIIGDRGKDNSPDSSDGVVSYESAHLPGAASEKIVPSGHSAHQDPEAIIELRRILRKHIGNPLPEPQAEALP